MNRQEFEDTARRYREELFRMYASQNITPEPKPAALPAAAPSRPAEPAAVPVAAPEQPMIPAETPPEIPPETPQRNAPPPEFLPQDQPVPQPPAPNTDLPPELPKRTYTGTIRVHVSTARGAMPVAGATVIITRTTSADPELISLQTTDESGNISAVTVAAPPPSADQRHPQSFLYDITAQAAGYYREHSTDVPVFPNITSMQNFDLIPLPAGADEPVPDGDITFYNNMQQY